MIEFLASESWIKPQIDFLVVLQNIRTEHFEFLNEFFLSVTVLGEFWLPTLICSIVYWCIDSKKGVFLFSLMGVEFVVAHFLKMIACVYRPWILSDRVKPVDIAMVYAKGYSFPSGHSITSASILGGVAYAFRKYKILSILLIIAVLLVGFSRMWLGVHTPQDVFVGLIIGFGLVFCMSKIIDWAEKDTKRYLYLMLILNSIVFLAFIYVHYFNHYPVDYVDGKILVDYQHMFEVAMCCWGYALGLANGVMLCRRFLPFIASEGSLAKKILRGVIGAASVLFLLNYAVEYSFLNVKDYKIAFLIPFVVGIFITLIYPAIFVRAKWLR